MAKVDSGAATPDERQRFAAGMLERSFAILSAPEEELFDVQQVEPNTPSRARLRSSVACEVCGETAMETRTRRIFGQTVCIPCFQRLESRNR
jgi:formylmethanofuran dehydrogenase subunit E